MPVKTVPLKADYSHDVKAMLAADPNAGVYYICNPNKLTGTMTPTADIEWLVNNKPGRFDGGDRRSLYPLDHRLSQQQHG